MCIRDRCHCDSTESTEELYWRKGEDLINLKMDSNSELTSIFENWLINPREDLDFEIKTWLNLNEQSARAKIAKELIALENH